MDIELFYKSVLESDSAPIVICDLNHTIFYMNPAAKARYQKHGELTGTSIFDCHNADSNEKIRRVVEWFKADKSHNKVYTFRNDKENKDVYMIALRDDRGELIGYYEKHEYRTNETMKKYDLI
ncbi:MAG: PAS domain-containing protein [Oscillospiraceae bacterium]|nr:PAS domain-containing protein [Oscillospiraceae bacterium]